MVKGNEAGTGLPAPPGLDELDPAAQLDPAVAEMCLALFETLRALARTGREEVAARELLRRHGLAPRHAATLAYLALSGPMSVSDLAGRLGVVRTTASLLVTELADAGLVDRREDVDDHRRTVAAVSPESRSEVWQMIEARLVPLCRAAERLGSGRVADLTSGLLVLGEELRGEECGDGRGESR